MTASLLCQPEKTEQMRAAFDKIVAPSRALEGVVSFDIAGDLTDLAVGVDLLAGLIDRLDDLAGAVVGRAGSAVGVTHVIARKEALIR